MLPLRFTICTYNIWGEFRWPEREAALQSFFELNRPDIVCLQEYHPGPQQVLDRVLASHKRIEDAFEGWLMESNIYWNSSLFEMLEYGAEQIGHAETLRRLFWVRLRQPDTEKNLLVATAHLTWPGHAVEKADGKNLRLMQAQNSVEVLNRISRENEPTLFMGDFNEYYHPVRILQEAGFNDCFSALGRVLHPTWPVLPTSSYKGAADTLDWLVQRGPLRPMNAEVVDFFHEDFAPSDHKPIIATYEL